MTNIDYTTEDNIYEAIRMYWSRAQETGNWDQVIERAGAIMEYAVVIRDYDTARAANAVVHAAQARRSGLADADWYDEWMQQDA